MPPAVLCGLLLFHVFEDNITNLHAGVAVLRKLPNMFPSPHTFSISCGFLRGESEDMAVGECSPWSVAALHDMCYRPWHWGDHIAAQPSQAELAPASHLKAGVPVLAVHREGKNTLWVSYLIPPFIFRQVWKHFSMFKGLEKPCSPVNMPLPGGEKREMAVNKEQNC